MVSRTVILFKKIEGAAVTSLNVAALARLFPSEVSHGIDVCDY
jgi:hypothetical protein